MLPTTSGISQLGTTVVAPVRLLCSTPLAVDQQIGVAVHEPCVGCHCWLEVAHRSGSGVWACACTKLCLWRSFAMCEDIEDLAKILAKILNKNKFLK